MNELGVAEDDGAGPSEKGDAVDAHRNKGYAVARWGGRDHCELEAAVEQAGMEVELIRGGDERLWKVDSPESFAVSPPHGLDGSKHRAIEKTAPCRGGIDIFGREMLRQTGFDVFQVERMGGGFNTCSDLCSGVAIPIRAGRTLAGGKVGGGIQGGVVGLKLDGFFAIRQMKRPQKFDVLDLELAGGKKVRADAEGCFNVAGTGEN